MNKVSDGSRDGDAVFTALVVLVGISSAVVLALGRTSLTITCTVLSLLGLFLAWLRQRKLPREKPIQVRLRVSYLAVIYSAGALIVYFTVPHIKGASDVYDACRLSVLTAGSMWLWIWFGDRLDRPRN